MTHIQEFQGNDFRRFNPDFISSNIIECEKMERKIGHNRKNDINYADDCANSPPEVS